MTDQTSDLAQSLIETGVIAEELKQSAIDAIVYGHSKGVEGIFDEELTGRRPSEYAAASATVDDVGMLSDEELFEHAQQVARSERGTQDFDAASEAAIARHTAIANRYNEHTFDPNTGEKVYKVTGEARKALELQGRAAFQEMKLAYYTAREVEKARAYRSGRREASDSEKAFRLAWAGSDPARAKLLNDAILRAEAEEAARQVLALRRSGRESQ